ncbi:MAG: hypothetical protein H6Q41_2557 [Deltaproteobacteria bacterium]|jgi:DNA gyrase inhibitor GyrI|nr:hypothetical protein [Deltaproteobacteria bacterium]
MKLVAARYFITRLPYSTGALSHSWWRFFAEVEPQGLLHMACP